MSSRCAGSSAAYHRGDPIIPLLMQTYIRLPESGRRRLGQDRLVFMYDVLEGGFC